MSNKLPWFTHDHGARNDEFIQRAEDQFGHFGYSAFFKILEIIHEHGTGGVLTMSRSRVCLNLRSRWPQVRLYLDFCQASGKLEFNLSGDEVQLQNIKFIERQSHLKIKAQSNRTQSATKPLPTRSDKDKENEIEKNNLVPEAPGAPLADPKPKPLTPQQIVIRYFKEAKGIPADDKDWDRKHWNGRLGKEANALLKAFDGDPIKAGRYLLIKGEEWVHLDDWGINGAIAAAGRDPRINAQTGDQEHERENRTLDADNTHGTRRIGGVTRAGEITGDTLAAIGKQAALHGRKQGQLDGPPENRFVDDTFEA